MDFGQTSEKECMLWLKLGWVANMPDSKHSVDEIVLISYKVQLFLHAAHVGVGKIGSIKVIAEVHQTAKRQDEEI